MFVRPSVSHAVVEIRSPRELHGPNSSFLELNSILIQKSALDHHTDGVLRIRVFQSISDISVSLGCTRTSKTR